MKIIILLIGILISTKCYSQKADSVDVIKSSRRIVNGEVLQTMTYIIISGAKIVTYSPLVIGESKETDYTILSFSKVYDFSFYTLSYQTSLTIHPDEIDFDFANGSSIVYFGTTYLGKFPVDSNLMANMESSNN